MSKIDINNINIDKTYEKLKKDTEKGGYYLNPDIDFTKELVKGLLINQNRYGYWACPCRLSSGIKEKDLDIICPCDYRDPDLNDYDTCYCGLYVSQKVIKTKKKIGSIPDRRNSLKKEKKVKKDKQIKNLAYPVWRCKVCGYLCAREHPPELCPVCKAEKDRFEIFM